MDAISRRRLQKVRENAPSTEEEAESRYSNWKDRDPFPEISSSLLNSADLCAYALTTGMIFPFQPTENDLKLATYAFRICGNVIHWSDRQDEKIKRHIEDGDEFKVPRNSISYVTLQPTLRIPNYIALRFNLKIDNVYKGLLLGTGPIVDPGYQGKLSIPLHNLTNNDYIFRGGDKIIWVEFTKISTHPNWAKGPLPPKERPHRDLRVHVPFPDPDEKRDVEYHLREALEDQPEETNLVRSSLGAGLKNAVAASEEAEEAAKNAENRAEEARSEVRRLSVGTLLAAVLAILAVVGSVIAFIQVVNNYHSDLDDVQEEVRRLERMVEENQ